MSGLPSCCLGRPSRSSLRTRSRPRSAATPTPTSCWRLRWPERAQRSSRAITICWCSISSEGFACWHPRRSGSGRLSSTTGRHECPQALSRRCRGEGDASWPLFEAHDERDRWVPAVIRLPRLNRRRRGARNRLGPFVTRGPDGRALESAESIRMRPAGGKSIYPAALHRTYLGREPAPVGPK